MLNIMKMHTGSTMDLSCRDGVYISPVPSPILSRRKSSSTNLKAVCDKMQKYLSPQGLYLTLLLNNTIAPDFFLSNL